MKGLKNKEKKNCTYEVWQEMIGVDWWLCNKKDKKKKIDNNFFIFFLF